MKRAVPVDLSDVLPETFKLVPCDGASDLRRGGKAFLWWDSSLADVAGFEGFDEGQTPMVVHQSGSEYLLSAQGVLRPMQLPSKISPRSPFRQLKVLILDVGPIPTEA